MTNPQLDPSQAHLLQLHVLISNLLGLIMCVNLCHVSRIQFKSARKAEKERGMSDSLIRRVFPESIGQEQRIKGSNLARSYQNVTVMFADIANFTLITTTMPLKS
jgi:class 3 adenylate cyclase